MKLSKHIGFRSRKAKYILRLDKKSSMGHNCRENDIKAHYITEDIDGIDSSCMEIRLISWVVLPFPTQMEKAGVILFHEEALACFC